MARPLSALVLRGAARVIATGVAVVALSWLCAEAAPDSMAERAARARGLMPADGSAMPAALRAEILARVAAELELADTAPRRLAHALGRLARGDLGRSWRDGAPVVQHLGAHVPATLLLLALALALALTFGLAAALAAARRPGSGVDTALSVVAALAFAVPPVWLGLLALRVFAGGHPWRMVPSEGLESVSAALLPVLCLALVPAFVIARHGRAALLEARRAPWAVAARARGASELRVLCVHASRMAVAPLAPLLPVLIAYLIGAVTVMEQVFAIRGVGALALGAASRGDVPVIAGVAALAGVLVATASLAADLVQRLGDPRGDQA